MPKEIKAGTADVVRYVMLVDATTGAPLTGLTVTAIDLQYTVELSASAAKSDGIVGTGGAASHVDDKVFEMDSASSPGLYMVCWVDAPFAIGNVGKTVILSVTHASAHPAMEEIILTADDNANIRDELNSDPVIVASVSGNVGGSVASVSGAVGSVSGSVGSVSGSVGSVAGSIGSLGATAKSDVQSECGTALGTYDGPTKAEMDTAHALLTTPAQVASALGTYDGPTKAEMDTAHALLATPANVNAEVLDVLFTDTQAELAALPAANAPLAAKINLIFELLRNKLTNDGSTQTLFKDNSSSALGTQAISKAAGTVTRAKYA